MSGLAQTITGSVTDRNRSENGLKLERQINFINEYGALKYQHKTDNIKRNEGVNKL